MAPPSTQHHAKDERPIIRAVLIDLSGTIHVGEQLINGAVEAVQKLLRVATDGSVVTVKFLTNTTKVSRSELLEQLWEMGFPRHIVTADNIITSTQAARQYLHDQQQQQLLRPYCLVEDRLLPDLGLVTATATTTASPSSLSSYNCVLVGLAPTAFHYERLNVAFRIVMAEKRRRRQQQQEQQRKEHADGATTTTTTTTTTNLPYIIALHRGKYFRDVDGGLSLGPGGFVSCLLAAADLPDDDDNNDKTTSRQKQPPSVVVMGKPSPEFFRAAAATTDDSGHTAAIPLEQVAMIGDDVQNDVLGSKRAGCRVGILVQTGKYQPGDEHRNNKGDGLAPDYVAPSIVEAVDHLIENYSLQ